MELVTILRELWHRRALVLIAAVLSFAVGLHMTQRVSLMPPKLQSKQFRVGLASTHVLLDTPDSQVVDLEPKGADALGTRTGLLANLMTSGPVRELIARDAGISQDQLLATSPSTTGLAVPTLLSQKAAESAKSPEAYILTVRADAELPIIAIDAQAPNAEKARKLADAAISGVTKYLKTVAASQRIPSAKQFVVRPLGSEVAAEALRGPRRLIGVALSFFLFIFLCTAIIVVAGIARGWRRAAAVEAQLKEATARLEAGEGSEPGIRTAPGEPSPEFGPDDVRPSAEVSDDGSLEVASSRRMR
jgi:capsular polysaccharide biosynthesis protein